MEEKLKDLKDVNFIFIDNMKQTLFDMMAIQKLLESEDLDYREQSSGSFYCKSKFSKVNLYFKNISEQCCSRRLLYKRNFPKRLSS